ncbi:hypothetical protein HMI56_004608 [Coelomomyces lativittatus]|nr:hypothetical protein HMI56_004608 [Coelomomyces lativittatus]
MNCNDKSLWEDAIIDKLNSMKKLNVFTLVQRPTGQPIIGCRYVFCIKKTDKNPK